MQIVLKDLKYHRGKDQLGNVDIRELKSPEVSLILADSVRNFLAQQSVECTIEVKE